MKKVVIEFEAKVSGHVGWQPLGKIISAKLRPVIGKKVKVWVVEA